MKFRRGDIYLANLSPVVGCEQSGVRPVLIVQNDIGNKYSPTVIVLAITTKNKTNLPTHIPISKLNSSLPKDSYVLVEQIRTIDKSRLIKKIGYLNYTNMERIKKALKLNFSIRSNFTDLFSDW